MARLRFTALGGERVVVLRRHACGGRGRDRSRELSFDPRDTSQSHAVARIPGPRLRHPVPLQSNGPPVGLDETAGPREAGSAAVARRRDSRPSASRWRLESRLYERDVDAALVRPIVDTIGWNEERRL